MKSIQMQLAGQPLKQASRIFDHDSIESQLEQFIDGKLAASVFKRNDDSIDRRLRPGKSLKGSVECLLALCLVGQHAVPTHDVHARVLAGLEQVDDRQRAFSRTQNIDPLPKDLSSDDPLVRAAPNYQCQSKKDETQQQDIVGDVCAPEIDR